MEETTANKNGRTSANNLDEGISRLDKTLNKIYLPEIMAARRVIHSRMRRKRERQMQGGRGGPTLYQFIMESRRRKMGSQQAIGNEHALNDVPEGVEKRQHNPPTRQDSVFQSVDLSEIAGLREDPNRTPTPQPTFTDGLPPQRQVVRKSEAVAALAIVSEKNQSNNSRSSSGHSSTRSDEIHEHYELQVRPGYENARQIEMATAACQSKDRSPLQRSISLEESSTKRVLEHRQNSTASDPGDTKERSVKKKQQTRQANELDLAQKIILKRKVEEYIDRQEPEATMEEFEQTTESTVAQEAAWSKESEVHKTTESISEHSERHEKKTGRESVQTVVSHKSESSTEEIDRKSVHESVQEEQSTGMDSQDKSNVTESSRTSSQNIESSRTESREDKYLDDKSQNSRSSSRSSSSDLNPHPVIPPIGTPPITERGDESVAEDNTVSENESEKDVKERAIPVSDVVVTTGAVAAGTGVAAAVVIKASKSEKRGNIEEKKQEKKVRKPETQIAKEEKEKGPQVKGTVASAAAANPSTMPGKSQKPDSQQRTKPAVPHKSNDKKTASSKQPKKPLSLKTANDMKSTIDALEQMVDNNIQNVIDNTKGKKTKAQHSEDDRRMVKAVMNPAFQAEINNFLAKT